MTAMRYLLTVAPLTGLTLHRDVPTGLPPGSRTPGLLQTIRYTFDQPGSFADLRRRFGKTFTLNMPGFPPIVVTGDRDAVRELFTGDPLRKRHGNDLLRPFFGDRSLVVLEPEEHLARRKLELPPFHGESVRALRGTHPRACRR